MEPLTESELIDLQVLLRELRQEVVAHGDKFLWERTTNFIYRLESA